jgi:filamentous hemagglutinin family protein
MMKSVLLRYSSLYSFATLLVSTIISPQAYSNPVDGQVVGGAASIVSNADKLDIYQHSDKAVIDWRSFDVGIGEQTQFHQPSSASSVLNRVKGGTTASQIDGAIKANGNVVLVNPNGVMFSKNATVDVGGLLATTADIDTQHFMKGDKNFNIAGKPNAKIVNDGKITAKQAGLVGLVAPHVENNGTINATLGKVSLGAGETFAVDLYGDKLIHLGVSQQTVKQLVRNTGTINAAGGEISLSAATGKQLVENLVQVKGELLAPSVMQQGGKIIITGDNANVSLENATIDASGKNQAGTILIGGDVQGTGTKARAKATTVDKHTRITANATMKGDGGKVIVWADDTTHFSGKIEAQGGKTAGNGGFVETSGKKKLSYDGTVNTSAIKGKTGTLLLDPEDITIATAAGDITPAAITSALGSNHVVIHTKNGGLTENGDITVSNDINYTSGNSLTLLATRHINANANIQNSGAGAVNLVAGWDQTTADPGGAAGTAVNPGGAFNIAAITGNAASYGNNNGSVFINNAAGTQGVAVGSKDGTTTVAGYDLALRGGNSNDEYAQLGYRLTGGTAIGDISAYMRNDTSLQSGAAIQRAYAQIGHGSTSGVFTSATGNILLNTRDVAVLGTGSGLQGYTMIGHGGYATNGTKGGNINIRARNVGTTANSSANNGFSQIGHGGQAGAGNMSGNITLDATGDVNLTGASSTAMIGHAHSFGGTGNLSGNISVNTIGDINILSPSGRESAQIGHGGADFNGNLSGNITVDARNITLSADSGEYAQIGHGGLYGANNYKGTGTRQGNVLVTATGEVSIAETGSAMSQIGSQTNTAGGLSNSNIRIFANALDFSTATTGTFNVNNSLFRDRMVSLLRGGDVTIGSTGTADMVISSADWAPSSSVTKNLSFLGTRNLRFNSSVQHDGTGQVNAVAGWDGTSGLNADGSITIGTITGNAASYGNNNGSVFINNAAGTQGASVGSRNGKTTTASYDTILHGGTTDSDYAQIGFFAPIYGGGNTTGDIDVYSKNNTQLITGNGSAVSTLAFIGHDGNDGASIGGNISVTAKDVSILSSDSTNFANGDGSEGTLGSQIGHFVFGSPTTVTGTINVNADNITIGGSSYNGLRIGHASNAGSGQFTHSLNGDIKINTTQNLLLDYTNASVQIGHGNLHAAYGNRSGNITLNVGGELSIEPGFYSHVIGHETSTAGGISNANIRILANSLDFADDAIDPTSFNLNNTNFRARMVANLTGGDVTIASKNAPITISDAWNATSASNRNLNFLSYGDINVNESITHNGNGGRVNLVAGWDGTNGINPADGSVDFSTLRLRDATDVGVLTLANTKTIIAGATTGTGIIAAAADRFTNNNAAGGLSAAGSRYVIYSTASGITTLGTLTPAALGGGYALHQPSSIAAGNHIVYDSNGVLTLLVGGQTYTYNGAAQLVTNSGAAGYGTYYNLDAASLTSLTGTGYTLGNFTGSLTGTATFSAADSTNATTGSDITGNINTLASSLGYDLSFNNTPTNELVIGKKSITAITGLTGISRMYDGTTTATLNTAGAGFTGIVGADTLNVGGYTANFADANAGVAKAISITGLSLGGASVGNYQLTGTTASATADITALPAAAPIPDLPTTTPDIMPPTTVVPPVAQEPVPLPPTLPFDPLSNSPNNNAVTAEARPTFIIPSTVEIVSQNGTPVIGMSAAVQNTFSSAPFSLLNSPEYASSESIEGEKKENSSDSDEVEIEQSNRKMLQMFGNLITIHPTLVRLLGMKTNVM